jgi:hypothetical protein
MDMRPRSAATMTTTTNRKADRKAQQARIAAAQQAAQQAYNTNCCPLCGNSVYRNNALAGWIQCDGFPTGTHRRAGHENDPKCHWQGFTQ